MSDAQRTPGWYVDQFDPRFRRHWDGASWSAPHPIPPKPQQQGPSVGKIALGVGLGVGGVLLALALGNAITQPSEDLRCSTQELEVSMGDRASVDRDCR